MLYSNGEGTNHGVTSSVGSALCQAIVAFGDGDYASSVDLIKDKRYQIQSIGGSNAQVILLI